MMKENKHSELGLASFIVSLAFGLLTLGLVVTAGILEASTPGGIDEETPQAILMGIGLLLGMGGMLVALGLGIAGLIQKDRKNLFAILGTVFSGSLLLLVLGVLILGSISE